jgi:hypothetical protein
MTIVDKQQCLAGFGCTGNFLIEYIDVFNGLSVDFHNENTGFEAFAFGLRVGFDLCNDDARLVFEAEPLCQIVGEVLDLKTKFLERVGDGLLGLHFSGAFAEFGGNGFGFSVAYDGHLDLGAGFKHSDAIFEFVGFFDFFAVKRGDDVVTFESCLFGGGVGGYFADDNAFGLF